MKHKPLLNLSLNYAHKNLSSAFRIGAGVLGSILIIVGIACLLNNNSLSLIAFTSVFLNLMIGLACIVLSSNYLPGIAKRFFIVSDDAISFKLSAFRVKKVYPWSIIEEIEIDQQTLKIRLETEHKPKTIYLGIISYDDFELLNKAIIDKCMEKNIDLK